MIDVPLIVGLVEAHGYGAFGLNLPELIQHYQQVCPGHDVRQSQKAQVLGSMSSGC